MPKKPVRKVKRKARHAVRGKPQRMSLLSPGPDLINPVDEADVRPELPSDPRIEKLARRLCEVEGTPPDELVTERLVPHGPKGLKMMPRAQDFCRAWEVYWREAEAALAMFDSGEIEKA